MNLARVRNSLTGAMLAAALSVGFLTVSGRRRPRGGVLRR